MGFNSAFEGLMDPTASPGSGKEKNSLASAGI